MREAYFYTQKNKFALSNSNPAGKLMPATSLPQDKKPSAYQATKIKAAELEKLSNGRLFLLDLHYRGDDERHLLADRNCGRKFRASFNEINTHGTDNACPWCSTPHSPDQFCSHRDLQHFVLERSHNNAFLCSPPIGNGTEPYLTLYCLVHRYTYQAKFSAFLRWAGSTNACPDCSLVWERNQLSERA